MEIGLPYAIEVTFTPPTDWGKRANGTKLGREDVQLWLFYLKDTAGTKIQEDIKKDITTALGADAVTIATTAKAKEDDSYYTNIRCNSTIR